MRIRRLLLLLLLLCLHRHQFHVSTIASFRDIGKSLISGNVIIL